LRQVATREKFSTAGRGKLVRVGRRIRRIFRSRLPERFAPAIVWILPVTFALAALSFYLVEKPAMRLGARVLSTPARPQSARQPC